MENFHINLYTEPNFTFDLTFKVYLANHKAVHVSAGQSQDSFQQVPV